MRTIVAGLETLRGLAQALAPHSYLLLFLLPGGSLMALIVYLHRRGWFVRLVGAIGGSSKVQRPCSLSAVAPSCSARPF